MNRRIEQGALPTHYGRVCVLYEYSTAAHSTVKLLPVILYRRRRKPFTSDSPEIFDKNILAEGILVDNIKLVAYSSITISVARDFVSFRSFIIFTRLLYVELQFMSLVGRHLGRLLY